MEKVLEVEHLVEKRKTKKIVSDISFTLGMGEVVGLIGPNGAGKTSILRCIVGLTRYNSGAVRICGHDLQQQHNQALAEVGCIIESPEFYNQMSGRKNLELAANMLNASEKQIDRVLKDMGLGDSGDKLVKTYSLGMRQRLGICQALLGNPKVLLLDEPLNGLDPTGVLEVKKILKQISRAGVSVLISSHQLSDLQEICSRFLMIEKGALVDDFTASSLAPKDDELENYQFAIETSNNQAALPLLQKSDAYIENNKLMVECSVSKMNKFLSLLQKKDILIYQVQNTESNLESLFKKGNEYV